MKVLHVYKTYLPDNFQGVARVIWEICEGVQKYGAIADVFSLSPSADPASVKVGHHVSHRARQDIHIASTSLSLSAFGDFRRLARDADILHYHFPWPMMDLLHLSIAAGRPAVVTYHSDVVRQQWLGRLYAPVMHRFLASMDRIVATSPPYAQTSPVLRRHASKVTVIPIGISANAGLRPDLAASWRQRLGPRFFLFVGALRYYKGLSFLVEAARMTGLPVVAIGSGEMAADIEQTRPANLILLGELDDPDRDAVISLCEGFVFPSHLRSEAFGVALLEAARAGKPMISCEIGTGTSYVNLDGETGFTIPPADSKALGTAMQQLWDSPARAASMGQQARARYEALFTGDRMAKAYYDVYRSVLDDRTAKANKASH